MNSLSLMLYAADISDSLKTVSIIIAMFSAIGLAFVCLIMAGENADLRAGIKYIWIPAIACIVAVVTPSSSTVYLMAASQAGEAIVTSTDGREMMSDLKEILRQKLKQELSATTQKN